MEEGQPALTQDPAQMQNSTDGNEHIKSIQKKLNGVQPEDSSVEKYIVEKYSIYRVPKLLRQTNEEAYTPALFPIGPYHHHHSQSQSQSAEADKTVEGLKLMYLKSFIQKNDQLSLGDYFNVVKEKKEKILECYAPPLTCSDHDNDKDNDNDDDEFIEMVLTDSAFLIQLFRNGIQPYAEYDMIWHNPSLKYEVLRDIMLLENQLPLFVLWDLLNMQLQGANDGGLDHLDVLLPKFLKSNYEIELDSDIIDLLKKLNQEDTPHLLALVRYHYVGFQPDDPPGNVQNEASHNSRVAAPNEASHNSPVANPDEAGHSSPVANPQQNNSPTERFPKATKLVNANVKFQVGAFLKFNPSEGTLTLPKLQIRDQTVCLYRNLIAYERCHLPLKPYFISYIYFLNCLIDSPEDIQVLVKNDIIETIWRSEDLSQMLHSLCKNVNFRKDFYPHTVQNELIKEFYHMKCNQYIGYLCREYSTRTPWKLISLVGAIWLLIATTIQTVFSVLAFCKGK